MLPLFFGHFEYWELRHKVTFDPALKYIIINPGETTIDIMRDIYSASKEWLKSEDNLRYRPPMRTVGGDPLPGGTPLGRTFFCTNGWRIYVDHSVNIVGNLYSDDYENVFVSPSNIQFYTSKVSNLVDVVEPSTSGLPEATAAVVWNTVTSSHQTPSTFGKLVQDIDAKVDDTQAIVLTK